MEKIISDIKCPYCGKGFRPWYDFKYSIMGEYIQK